MKTILLPADFEAWRDVARDALRQGYQPDEIDLQDASSPRSLDLSFDLDGHATGTPVPAPHVAKRFIEDAAMVAAHRSPARWNLLYRVLFRLQQNRDLLKVETDSDISEMLLLGAQVRRDLHKMHAFVRFRKITTPAEAREERQSDIDNEHYIAWHQPDHRILKLAAPFFAERFAVMRWSILTPDATVSWDPVGKELRYGVGVAREAAPAEDELETLWRTYYRSIFNPARLNLSAMRSEMPVRYWKNLPELSAVPELVVRSTDRVATMVREQQNTTSAASWVPEQHTVEAVRQALPACKGCELYRDATQVVPGHGSNRARMLVVGEQPGDQEDLRGLPFVGPAGKLLDQTLKELGISRMEMYLTNAVKHFKFVQRGKLRLHQNPRMSEITACRPWLLAEIDAIQPKVVLCLGASAAKALFGGTFALMKDRGKVLSTPFVEQVVATLHPSAILRARDDESREQMMAFFKADLIMAANLASG
jgi:probable DNA metabolism protein